MARELYINFLRKLLYAMLQANCWEYQIDKMEPIVYREKISDYLRSQRKCPKPYIIITAKRTLYSVWKSSEVEFSFVDFP